MANLGTATVQLRLDPSQFRTAVATIAPTLQQQIGAAERSAVTGLGNAGRLGGQAFGVGVSSNLGAISPALVRSAQSSGVSSAFGTAGRDAGRSFVGNFTGSISGVVGSVRNIGIQAGSAIRESFKNVGQGIGQGIGQNIAQGILSGIGKIGGAIASTKNIGNYDAAVRQIKTLGVNYSEFEATAKRVTKALGDNSDIVTTLDSLYDVASSGFTKASDAAKILTASVKLATTSNSELADVQGTVLGTLNAYGMGAEKATEVSNKLFGAINAGRMNGKELAASFGDVVGTAAAAGVSLDETLSLLAVATLKSIKVPQAITGLRALIDQFSNLSNEGKKALNDLGVKADATIVKQRGVYAIVKEIEAKGATPEQTAAIFASSEARKIVTAVKGQSSAGMFDTSGKTISSTNIDGSFKDVSEGIIKRTEAAKNKLITLDVELKKGVFGSSLLSALGAINKGIDIFANGLTKLNNAYQTLSPQQKGFVNAIGGGVVILGGLAAAIAGVGIAIGLIGPTLVAAGAIVSGFAVGLGSITLAAAPIAVPLLAAGAAVGLLAKAFGATDSQAFAAGLTAVGAGIAIIFGPAALSAIGAGVVALVTGFGSIAVAAGAALVPLAPFIAAGAAIAVGLFGLYKVFERFKPEIMAFTATLQRALSGAMNDIPSTFNKVIGFFSGFFAKSINMVISWGTGIGNSVKNWTGSTANAISKWISGLTGGLGGLRDFIGKAFSQSVKFGESLKDGFMKVFNPIIGKIKEVMDWIGGLTSKVGEAANSLNVFGGAANAATVPSGGVFTPVVATGYTPGEGNVAMEGGKVDHKGKYLDKTMPAIATRTNDAPGGIPYGSIVEVRDPKSGRTTTARAVDRGSLQPGVDADLTTAVFEKLGIPIKKDGTPQEGHVKLEIRVVSTPSGKVASSYDLGVHSGKRPYDSKGNYIGNFGKAIAGMMPISNSPLGGIMGAAQSAWNYGRSLFGGGGVASPVAGKSVNDVIANKGVVPGLGNYGAPRPRNANGKHNGVDFNGPVGTPVYAPYDGVATYSGANDRVGSRVTINSSDGKVRTVLLHLSDESKRFFANGGSMPVKAGQRVGDIGRFGRVYRDGTITGSKEHVHVETRINGKLEDPSKVFSVLQKAKAQTPSPNTISKSKVVSAPVTGVSTPAQNRLDDANAKLQEAEAEYYKLQNQVNPDKEAIEAAKKKRDRLQVVLKRIIEAQRAAKKKAQDRQKLTPQSIVNAPQIADADSALQRRIDDAAKGLAEAQTALTKLQNQTNPASADQIQAAKNRVAAKQKQLDRAIKDAKQKNEKIRAKTIQQSADEEIAAIGTQISIIDSDARLATSKIDTNTDKGKTQAAKIKASQVARQRALLPRINALRAKYAKQSELVAKLNDFESSINEIAKPDKPKEVKTLTDVELLEQQIRQIDAVRTSKDNLTDLAVSRRQVTAETGTIVKSGRLADAAKRLASLLPQINNLKAKYSDNPEIRSKIDEIENVVITRQRESADAQNSLNSGKLTKVKAKIEGLISENDRQTERINNNVLSGGTNQAAGDQAILSNKIALNAELQKQVKLLEQIKATTTNTEDRKAAIESLDQLARFNAETSAALRGDTTADVAAQVESFKKQAETIIKIGEQRQTDAQQNLINNPESTTAEQTAANILVIRQQTAKLLSGLIPLLEEYRAAQTDNAVIESLNEQLARYRQITTETKAATDEAKKAAYESSVLGQTTKSLTDTLGSGLQDVFRDAFKGFSSLGNILDGIIGKIADIGINALIGGIGGGGGKAGTGLLGSVGSIFGFENGGTIRNYSAGGSIAGALNLASAYSKAMRKEGAGAVPLVGKIGEEMLSIPNAQIYRAMVRDGHWEQMKKIYNYSNGGTVGAAQSVTPRSISSRSNATTEHRITVDRINSVDYVSLDQVQAMFEAQIPIAAKAGAALSTQNLSNTVYRQQNGIK